MRTRSVKHRKFSCRDFLSWEWPYSYNFEIWTPFSVGGMSPGVAKPDPHSQSSGINDVPMESRPNIIPSAGSDIVLTKSLLVDVNGEPRHDTVRLPAAILGQKPGALPNDRVSEDKTSLNFTKEWLTDKYSPNRLTQFLNADWYQKEFRIQAKSFRAEFDANHYDDNTALLWQKEASDMPSKSELHVLMFSYFTLCALLPGQIL